MVTYNSPLFMHLSMSCPSLSFRHSEDLTKLGVKGPSIGTINLVKSPLYPHPLTGAPPSAYIWDSTTCSRLLLIY